MRHIVATLLVTALTVPLSALASPSLLTNGSFEDGSVLASGAWGIYSALPGWQGDPTLGIELRRNAAGTAQDGSHFVELDTTGNSSMSQSVSTTAGAHYLLSWYYSPRAGVAAASNAIEVFWNDVLLTTHTGSGIGFNDHQWLSFSFDVVGTGGLDTVRFAAAGNSDSVGGSLDNVALVLQPQAVPEPASLLLALGGLGLLAGCRRRG